MSRITGVIVALATAAAVLTGSTSGAAPPPAPDGPGVADLPREIERGVELTMADGDLLRLWAATDYRTVWSRRRDAATGAWGPRLEVLHRKHLFCGDVDARTSGGAVAAMVQCDVHGYAEDQAPVGSQALWSPDGVTWSSYALEGEAYDEPGISPSGANAVWLQSGGYVTRTTAGFAEHDLDTPGQEYTATATITDDAQVSYLYGAHVTRRRCGMVVLTRTGDAAPTRQDVEIDDACQDRNFANVDASTAVFGDFESPASVAVISRPDASSPWAVTRVAPDSAPGLVRHEGRLSTDYFTAPGAPLVALGSRRGRQVRAQVYDPVAQTWGPASTVYDAGSARCRWGDSAMQPPLAVLVVALECGKRRLRVVLTTRDGATWQALRSGVHPIGVSDDGRYVAVPGRSRTWVVSPKEGVVTLPGGATGACDVVVPDGPEGAVLLSAARRDRGWPTVLSHSSAGGWSRLARTRLPVLPGRCSEAQTSFWELPVTYLVLGTRDRGYSLRILRRDGEWDARRWRY